MFCIEKNVSNWTWVQIVVLYFHLQGSGLGRQRLEEAGLQLDLGEAGGGGRRSGGRDLSQTLQTHPRLQLEGLDGEGAVVDEGGGGGGHPSGGHGGGRGWGRGRSRGARPAHVEDVDHVRLTWHLGHLGHTCNTRTNRVITDINISI